MLNWNAMLVKAQLAYDGLTAEPHRQPRWATWVWLTLWAVVLVVVMSMDGGR